MNDERYERYVARHEAAHLVLAEAYTDATPHVYLSEDGGATHIDLREVDPDSRVEIALAGPVGSALDDAKAKGLPLDRIPWNSIAEIFLFGSSPDAKMLRVALAQSGWRGTKAEGVEYVADLCRVVAGELTSRSRRWATLTKEVLAGEHTPVRPSGHFMGNDGPVYYGASLAPMPERRAPRLDADPFIAPAKRKRKPRLIRDKFGRLLGLSDGE